MCHKRLIYPLFLVALICFYSYRPLKAQSMSESDLEAGSLADTAALVDRYVADHMEAAHAPGLVITIVHQGQVILEKGYGYADLDQRRPMTPQTNLRVGSVSKPVTSAAVLQLVERGELELTAPISAYLPDLPRQDQFGPASTIAQLLSLKGGYANSVLLSHAPTLDQWQPLDKYVAENLPPRTVPPGLVHSYSSWDHALLGYAMEKVSGRNYDQIIAQNLFQPLGMAQTTFSQPLPESIAANLATGYAFEDGAYQVVPLDYVRLSPGVALVTTAADMGRFMLALLNGGELDGIRVLESSMTDTLLTRQEEVHPFSRGRSYGFAEINLAGRPALYHDGNGIGFGNRIILVPDQALGVFLSINHRALGHDARNTPAYRFLKDLSTVIVEELVPPTAETVTILPAMPDAASRAKRYTGHYRLAETPQNDFFKVGALLDNVNVKDNGDGSIMIGSRRYHEVEPLLFQSQQDPGFFVVFTEDQEQHVSLLTFGGTGAYQKVSWFETPVFQAVLAAFMLLSFLSYLILSPIRGQRHWLIWTISLLDLLVLAGVGIMFLGVDLILFFKMIPWGVRMLLLLPWLSGLITLALPVVLWRSWRQSTSWGPKLHGALTTAAAFAFIWFIYYWNLYLI